MNHPNPAIVAQAAVRRLPRWALVLMCIAYVCAGFVGREAWRSEDMAALGYMGALAQGAGSWMRPELLGVAADNGALLPYWLGAWAIQLAPSGVPLDFAARVPFGLLLALALLATWYGTYYLGRSPLAQPVAFAFGGEAKPTDYARAMADAGVLAFVASLGLAQLAHETTPALAQLAFSALLFYAVSALPYRKLGPAAAIVIGLMGLALSGAPMLAVLFGLGGAVVHWREQPEEASSANRVSRNAWESLGLLLATLATGLLAMKLHLWRWKIVWPAWTWADWNGYAQLLIWFTWPSWPLALWTLWRWRFQLFTLRMARHVALPAWFAMVTVLATLVSSASDRTLLLALPAMASLAAFALPTLKRQVAALIDWFTLLFFSGCGFTIWVVWIAMQTGVPHQPAANVARLAPGFEPTFSTVALGFALAATAAWAWLVRWRVGRHRAAIWKSLVLPAGGAALCWLLLMTLWMPLLNYAQSYTPLVQSTAQMVGTSCVQVANVNPAHMAALQWYGHLDLRGDNASPPCPWLVSEPGLDMEVTEQIDTTVWVPHALLRHPVDRSEAIWLLRRR